MSALGRARLSVALVVIGALVAASGCRDGGDKDTSAGEFFTHITRDTTVEYPEPATFEEAAAAADLVVIGRIAEIASGPTIEVPGQAEAPTVELSVEVERVVAGESPTTGVEFVVVRRSDLDVDRLDKRRPDERLLLLLLVRPDGLLEFGGPHTLLVEEDAGPAAPLANNAFRSSIEGFDDLDDAASAIAN